MKVTVKACMNIRKVLFQFELMHVQNITSILILKTRLNDFPKFKDRCPYVNTTSNKNTITKILYSNTDDRLFIDASL